MPWSLLERDRSGRRRRARARPRVRAGGGSGTRRGASDRGPRRSVRSAAQSGIRACSLASVPHAPAGRRSSRGSRSCGRTCGRAGLSCSAPRARTSPSFPRDRPSSREAALLNRRGWTWALHGNRCAELLPERVRIWWPWLLSEQHRCPSTACMERPTAHRCDGSRAVASHPTMTATRTARDLERGGPGKRVRNIHDVGLAISARTHADRARGAPKRFWRLLRCSSVVRGKACAQLEARRAMGGTRRARTVRTGGAPNGNYASISRPGEGGRVAHARHTCEI